MKQEEIIREFTEILRTNLSGQGLIDSNAYEGFCVVLEDAVLQGFNYLHSQGVVIKGQGLGAPHLASYFAVEPLIKE